MAETTADVRRDIELTRERMSNTLAELEKKLNAMEIVREHPWPAIALAAGVGFALSGTNADVKAAAATATLAHGAGNRASRLGPALDDLVAKLVNGVQDVVMERADELIAELRGALGGSPRPASAAGDGSRQAPGIAPRAVGAAGVSAGAGTGAGAGLSSAGDHAAREAAYGSPSGAAARTGAGWAPATASAAVTGGTSGAAFGGESRDANRSDPSADQPGQRPLRAD